jgi:hypothetical protein
MPAVRKAPRKLRFAVAIYALPATLAGVAIALAELGVTREQLHLVARDDALATASRELALTGHPQRLTELARCMTYQETHNGHPWVMELLAASAAADGRITVTPRLEKLKPLGPRIEGSVAADCVDKGGGVVIVHLDADTSEQDVCGLMLRHHSMSVQTHDLRRLD